MKSGKTEQYFLFFKIDDILVDEMTTKKELVSQ
jgi:hypothetical protein